MWQAVIAGRPMVGSPPSLQKQQSLHKTQTNKELQAMESNLSQKQEEPAHEDRDGSEKVPHGEFRSLQNAKIYPPWNTENVGVVIVGGGQVSSSHRVYESELTLEKFCRQDCRWVTFCLWLLCLLNPLHL